MITSFGNQATADLFNGINSRNSRKISSEITQKALNKLDILNAVEKLDELKNPPGNRLEALKDFIVFGLTIGESSFNGKMVMLAKSR